MMTKLLISIHWNAGNVFVAIALTLLCPTPQTVCGIEPDKPYGEPYQLAGKRLVFTNWYFVRIGQLDWINNDGKSVFANKRLKAGPLDAHFAAYDAPSGIRLAVEPAVLTGPVVTRDRPWEKMGLSIDSILFDEGKFRAWGHGQSADGQSRACYFESTDGRAWSRPSVGLVEFGGNKENNLLPIGPGAVFKDPTAPAGERYKTATEGAYDAKLFAAYKAKRPWSVMAIENKPGRVHAIRASVSPDGLTWTELPEPISVETSDTQIVANYDAHLKKYVMFTRSYMVGPRAHDAPPSTERRNLFVPRRAIGRSESQNFREFPLSETILEPGCDMPPTDTFYTNSYTTIPGAADQHLMFPAVYHQDSDTTSIDLYTSDDTKLWHRVPGSPVTKTGNFGQWDGGCVFAHPNLIELPDGTWELPITAYLYPHKYPRGAWAYDAAMAVWEKGRLMSLEAPENGAFTTVAVIAPGAKLRINAVTERAGNIRIEAADLEGKPISGRTFDDALPIVGDQFRTLVKWKQSDDLGVHEGQPVVLRVRMSRAKIYGLDFE